MITGKICIKMFNAEMKPKTKDQIAIETYVDEIRCAYTCGLYDRPQRFDALAFFTILFAFSWLVFTGMVLALVLK